MYAVHILAGTLALVSGLLVLITTKGSGLHKKIGNVFFFSMIFVSLSALALDIMLSQMPSFSLLTLYLITTSWLTVRRPPEQIGKFEIFACVMAYLTSFTLYYLGWQVTHGEQMYGIPPEMTPIYFVTGTLALFAATLDTKMLVNGGIAGVHRIARHLWRMCLAFIFAMMSFLSQDVFSEAVTASGVLWIPVLILVLLLFYWLVKVIFFSQKFKKVGESVI
ncbi:hypothetical protein PSECIP111854_01017 [Pseudoalteromonas sp. CIP111854]|uniref:DUF2306 domain-containing protein n=1 Tax=Pseudoalteromonas holothuriae TaxID=2963714 RepID=A0A9W4QTZ6_9GAMM|nr:hypothetical protein [Pseudoalteromonas sp. CIP111854]CAH9052670.1 hypothetical protein PSECIP111854_01017 [Pseudoalteromonas sp. CIP111854]